MAIGSLTKGAITKGVIPLGDLKAHLRVTHSEDDLEIVGMARAALEYVETVTRRMMFSRTCTYRLPRFPKLALNDDYRTLAYCSPNAAIVLPVVPVSSVTQLDYVDVNGDPQTLAGTEYYAVLDDSQAYLLPEYGKTWPDSRASDIAVTITFVAGYATIPQAAVHAMKLLVGNWYENREAVGQVGRAIELSCNALLETLKSNYTVAI